MAKDHSININATELAVIAAALFFSFHLFLLIYFSVYFLKLSMEPPLLDWGYIEPIQSIFLRVYGH